MLKPLFLVASLVLSLSACQAPKPMQPKPETPTGKTLEVYKAIGPVRQCEQGGASLTDRQTELQAAQVKVLSSSCGSTGRMQATVCGGGTSSIGIFTIAAEDGSKAQLAEFTLLSNLPDASKFPCN